MVRAVKFAFLISLASAVSVPAASWRHHHAKAKPAPEASAGDSTQALVPKAKDVHEPAPSELRAGTVIKAELQSTIDSQTTRVSDQVVARVISDVQQDNQTLVHSGDRLIGRVASVENAGTQSGSAVSICFDRVVTRHSVMPLHTVLIAALPAAASERDASTAAPLPVAVPRRSSRTRLPAAGATLSSAAASPAVGSTGSALTDRSAARTAGQLSAIRIDSQMQADRRVSSSLSTPQGQLRLDSGTGLQFEVRSSEQTVASK